MKVGEKFWLLPSPFNPLMVLVEVLQVNPKGYLVDEPVGFVGNPNCICPTREDAEALLKKLHAEGHAILLPEHATQELNGLRNFLQTQAAKLKASPELWSMPLREKKRGEEWFNLQDLEGKP